MWSWIQAAHVFDPHYAVFRITHKHMLMLPTVFDELKKASSQINGCDQGEKLLGLEKAITDLIVQFRPELANCTIRAIEQSIHSACWDIGVCHPSLPPTSPWKCPEPRPLDPRLEAVMATDALYK